MTPYVAFCDSDVVPRPGLARHPAPAPRRPGARGGRAAGARPGPARRRRLDRSLRAGPLLPRPRARAGGGPPAGRWSPTSRAPACSRASTRSATASTSACAVGEDVDLVWRLLAGGPACATSPPPPCGTGTAPDLGEWLRPQGVLRHLRGAPSPPGTGPPWPDGDARPGPASVAVAAARPAALVGARGAGRGRRGDGRDRPAAAPQRPARAGGRRAHAGGQRRRPVADLRRADPALLAARGAGRRRGRDGPDGRCWSPRSPRGWPIAGASGPHLDPLRYVLARRLDDLAYGSGVWLGRAPGRGPCGRCSPTCVVLAGAGDGLTQPPPRRYGGLRPRGARL